ncbi:hypothetical protein SAMN05216428_10198 [Nitrosospira sp. Nsp11]|uniref:hypothetical protein n=1 Tax=Nitrosospira sp. Nsp11 TaxID=1855338 RepID=UPI000921B1DE|nr:hypothetical protein [Nitrosospira sp. Nsp11]SHL10833.1 hypothetical protein SAMN05216428_10198 [Nitrosospira sp. Nsp11]
MSETKPVTAADVRAAFPQCVRIADEFRAAFGPEIRLTFAEEGGQRIGIKGGEPSDITVTAAQMIIEVPEEPKKQPKKEKVRYG